MVSIENNIIYSTIPEEIHPKENLVKFMFEKFDQWPDREIIIDGVTGKSWTAKQFKSAISSVSASFVSDFSMVKGDIICFHCHNCDIVAIAAIATIAVGGIYTGSQATGPYCKHNFSPFQNISNSNDTHYFELYNTVSRTKASFIVIDKVKLDIAVQVAQECGFIKKIFVVDDEQSDESRSVYSLSSLLNNPLSVMFDPVVVDQDDVCVIHFSSGTTGLPKPVPKTHRNMLANRNCNLDSFDFANAADVIPIHWDLGYSLLMKQFTMSLLVGSKIVVFPDFGIKNFCGYFERYKFNIAVLVPSYIIQMVKTDYVSKDYLSSLEDVFVTGSILSEVIAAAFVNKYNIKYLRQLYGTTEVSTCVMQRKVDNPNENLRCAGIPPPGYSVKIVDRSTGIALGANCVGELYTKGPTVMSGFLNMPQVNLEAFDEHGYYKTGDAAHYDTSGRIFIVDRYKNILKYEGGAISCAELEFILMKHPQIKEVCVIGIEHEVFGEVPRAFVVVDHGELSRNDVMNFVENHVDYFKRLYGGVIFVDSLPKNTFGKINRRALVAITFN